MKIDTYCNKIQSQYGEYLSKEQMYRICHIGKSTCLDLLSEGVVPCIDTGKSTHRYKIRTADVIAYLKGQDEKARKYIVLLKRKSGHIYIDRELLFHLREYYEDISKRLPDLMDVYEVSGFTGYSEKTVRRWCNTSVLKHLTINRKFLIPHEYLLDFMISDYYLTLIRRSKNIPDSLQSSAKKIQIY